MLADPELLSFDFLVSDHLFTLIDFISSPSLNPLLASAYVLESLYQVFFHIMNFILEYLKGIIP